MDLAPRLRHPTYPRRPRPAGCDHESAEQPAAISGATPASFQYDAFGRRVQKTLGNTATALLYDGPNAVQERVGSSVTNLLAGLGIDEQLTRTDGAGTRTLLADALGSTVALVDGSGTVQPEYTYEPFGATTGASGPNPYQFTGREHDGTGLYYYRARYYRPALQRFLSEDPLGFGGGDPNLYAYVGNPPTTYSDPLGLCLIGGAAGAKPGHFPGCSGGGTGGIGGGWGAPARPGTRPGEGLGGAIGGIGLAICYMVGGCGGQTATPPPPPTSDPKPKPCAGGSGDEGPFLYRRGGRNPKNYEPDPVDGGVSMNLDPRNLPPGEIQVFDPSKLPPGSWTPDEGQPVPGKPGQVYGRGHVSVRGCTHEQFMDA
jgi:RHS repeat-associated protein